MEEAPRVNSRQRSLFLINLAAFVCMLGSAVTGIIMWLFTETGPGANKYFGGWHRHQWGDLHLYFSLVLLALAAYHLIQHWRWIKTVTPAQTRARAGLVASLGAMAAALIVVFGLFFLLSKDPSAYREEEGGGSGRGQGGGSAGGRSRQSEVQDTRGASQPDSESSDTRREMQAVIQQAIGDETTTASASIPSTDTNDEEDAKGERRQRRNRGQE